MWAHLGSNQGPPDYEFQIGISIHLHRFVSVWTSLIYFTIKIKYYTGLHEFLEILAPKLAPNFKDCTLIVNSDIKELHIILRPKERLNVTIEQ
jgi:hypothetical protein